MGQITLNFYGTHAVPDDMYQIAQITFSSRWIWLPLMASVAAGPACASIPDATVPAASIPAANVPAVSVPASSGSVVESGAAIATLDAIPAASSNSGNATSGNATTDSTVGNTGDGDDIRLKTRDNGIPLRLAITPAEILPEPLPFPDSDLSQWSEKSFQGNTRYSLVESQGISVLQGSTLGQASVMYRESAINLAQTPWLDWSWKVDRVFPGNTEQQKSGDDFPARLYVVAQIGFLPWETLAVNYVWASEVPSGTVWLNPFTDKAAMVAIQSGDAQVGQWTRHRRNVEQDFRAIFNQSIDVIAGYAVMVDGDNSQREATSWFGHISFSEH